MATIIDNTYLQLEVSIPQGRYSIVDKMIERYEPEIMRQALGATLYKLMQDNVSESIYKRILEPHEYEVDYMGQTHKVFWNGLKNDQKISLIAYYVYYQWVRNRVTMTVYTGEIKPLSENSEQAPVSAKLSYAWRLMKELYGYPTQSIIEPSLYNLLVKYESDYPTWLFKQLGSVNIFDL